MLEAPLRFDHALSHVDALEEARLRASLRDELWTSVSAPEADRPVAAADPTTHQLQAGARASETSSSRFDPSRFTSHRSGSMRSLPVSSASALRSNTTR